MRIISAPDYASMSRKAANLLSAQVILKPDCVLGLATGGTPVGVYKQLVNWYEKGDLDFSKVHTVNLDEYIGLPVTHPQSYRSFMNDNLFNHVNIPIENTNVPQWQRAQHGRRMRALRKADRQLRRRGHAAFGDWQHGPHRL